jgi:hypothetical protein
MQKQPDESSEDMRKIQVIFSQADLKYVAAVFQWGI